MPRCYYLGCSRQEEFSGISRDERDVPGKRERIKRGHTGLAGPSGQDVYGT